MASKNCIGLDIGSSAIKVVHIKETSKGMDLINFGIEPLPPQTIVDGTIMNQSAVAEAIRAVAKRMKIRHKEVAIAIAGHSVIIKKITVPVMTQQELEEQIGWEAGHHIPFDRDDVELDHQILVPRTAQGQMEVLLVAAKKEVVHDYAAVAREAGFRPVVVDVAAFSVQNSFEANYTVAETESSALINVGATISTINIVSHGLSLFTRDVTIGGNAFTEEIQKQLSVSYEEAEAYKLGGSTEAAEVVPQELERVLAQVADTLAGEFQRSLDFYLATSAEGNIHRIYLAGGSAAVPALRRAIEGKSRLPCEALDPFKRMTIDQKRFDMDFLQANAPMAAVAVGLSLRHPGDSA
ncbi:MAG: type IV pilus assembly protein PilM [Myxococcota bacterium]